MVAADDEEEYIGKAMKLDPLMDEDELLLNEDEHDEWLELL